MANFMMSRNFQDALHDIRLTEKFYPSTVSIFCFNSNYFSEKRQFIFPYEDCWSVYHGQFLKNGSLGVIINTE